MSFADYHDDISGIAFEDQIENTLTANLPKQRKVMIVMENAKYQNSRLIKHEEG